MKSFCAALLVVGCAAQAHASSAPHVNASKFAINTPPHLTVAAVVANISKPVIKTLPQQTVAAVVTEHATHSSHETIAAAVSVIEARDASEYLMAQKAGKQLPEFRFFKPRCIQHMRRVLRRIDLSYTDEQLRTVLEHECIMENDFPTTHEDGFEQNRACKAYADDLAAARDEELATGNTNGYEVFCKNYYVHKGGKLEQPTGESKVYAVTPVRKEFMKELKKEATEAEQEGDKVEKQVEKDLGPKTKEHQLSWIPIIMIALLVIILVVLVVMRSKQQRAEVS